jgi:tetratricopeptide (TPR) repeat protein
MTSGRYFVRCLLLILAFCTVVFGGQTEKQTVPPSPTHPPPLSAREIFKRVSPSVMIVESLDAKGSIATFGSGVVVASGNVITNRHVIENGVSFRVEHAGKGWPAKLVGVDPDHDLAELSVAGLDAPSVRVRDSSTLAVGENVYAIGAPEGLELTISEGLISGLRDFDNGRVIQTSAAISPGSSGGGLFDTQGRLVGITTFYLKEGQSLNFALPAEWTLALTKQPAKPVPAATESSPIFQRLGWFELGYTLAKAGKYTEAAHAFQEAARLKPDDEHAWLNLGIIYTQLKQYDKAMNAEENAIRLKPDDTDAWKILGAAYRSLAQYDKAISADQKAISLKPDDTFAWIELGYAYDALEQYEKEATAFEEAIKLKPSLVEAWINLGIAYEALGQYDKAISAEQEVLRLRPNSTPARVNLAGIYGKQRRYQEEVEVSREAIRLEPHLAQAWATLGQGYSGLRQYDAAVTSEREAIRLKPSFASAWYLLGLALKAKGEQTEVIKVYEKLKALDPELAGKFSQKVALP